MEHGQSSCKPCKNMHNETGVLLTQATRHSKIMQGMSARYLVAAIEARLEFKRTGSMSSDYAAAGEAGLGAMMRDQVNTEYRETGKDPSVWLSCLAVENRVRSITGGIVFILLEKAAKGEGDPMLLELIEDIMCKLFDTCICFGDGPRCHVDVVDSLFVDFIGTGTLNP
jgi:hypothetical protein